MTEKDKNNQIIIYKNKSGEPLLDVRVEKETVWLTQKQIAQLFDIDRSVITKHLNNIYKNDELDEDVVCAKIAHTTKHGAMAGKTQTTKVNYYNLDAIISVGYRVNSKRATQFRIWATKTLREHIINGYTINEKRLLEEKGRFSDLRDVIKFIEKQADHYLLQNKTRELLSLLNEYSQALSILKQYDEGKVKIGKKSAPTYELTLKECQKIIKYTSVELRANNEAGDLFGSEIADKFKSIIGAVYQTFDGRDLYKSIEEKAANILYLVIKDHPFSDGNKRLGAILFIYFLKMNDFLYKDYQKKISNNALASLALLVATSDPRDKELLVKIIISLIQ